MVVSAICAPLEYALGDMGIDPSGSVFHIEDVEEESFSKAVLKYLSSHKLDGCMEWLTVP